MGLICCLENYRETLMLSLEEFNICKQKWCYNKRKKEEKYSAEFKFSFRLNSRK